MHRFSQLVLSALAVLSLACGSGGGGGDGGGGVLVPGAVSAGMDQTVLASTRTILTPSEAGTTPIASYSWNQTAGPPVTIEPLSGGSAAIVTPSTSTELEFEVTARRSNGSVIDRDRVSIVVDAVRPEISSDLLAEIEINGGGTGRATAAALHDETDRLFVIDSVAGEVVVYDVSDPAAPFFAGVAPRPQPAPGYTPGAPLAIACGSVGPVAVTWSGETIEFPGRLQFLDATTLGEINAITTAGANPVDVDVSLDGDLVAVACAGDREFFGQGDGRGYVTIVRVPASGPADIEEHEDVAPITFNAYEGQESALAQAGVRFFGTNPNASTAMAPRAVAISRDESVVWAACPKNDALAIVDPVAERIASIVALADRGQNSTTDGTWADPARETYTTTYTVATSPAGDDVRFGGITGIVSRGASPNSLRVVTGSGPTLAPVDLDGDTVLELPFVDPLASLVVEEVRFEGGELVSAERVTIAGASGEPVTGQPGVYAASPGLANHDERAVDLLGNPVPTSGLGARFAGATELSNGEIWLADARRNAIWRLDADGRVLDRLLPEGTQASIGTIALPATYTRRRLNLAFPEGRRFGGFGAIAFDAGRGSVLAIPRLPLENPQVPGGAVSETSLVVRVLELDASSAVVIGEYALVLDATGHAIEGLSSNGSPAYFPAGLGFLEAARDPAGFLGLYALDFDGATNLRSLSPAQYQTVDEFLETTPTAELSALGVTPLGKHLVADLSDAGLVGTGRASGLLLDGDEFVVSYDEGFGGMSRTTFDPGTGSIAAPAPIAPLAIGFGTLRPASIDTASNGAPGEEPAVPVDAMPQPLDLASYRSEDGTQLVALANGGFPRVLPSSSGMGPAYDERVLAGDLTLDTNVFPNAAQWRPVPFGGDLIVSDRDADLDGDGLADRLALFGARSIGVAGADGDLVWSSPTSLNARTRRRGGGWDDAGAELFGARPRAVAVGFVAGTEILATSLEGAREVVVHSLENPFAPTFLGFAGSAERPVDVDVMPLDLDAALLAITDEDSGTVQLRRLRSD